MMESEPPCVSMCTYLCLNMWNDGRRASLHIHVYIFVSEYMGTFVINRNKVHHKPQPPARLASGHGKVVMRWGGVQGIWACTYMNPPHGLRCRRPCVADGPAR